MVSAILFDVDGTLVDTNPAHVEAWLRAFRDEGFEISRERIEAEIGKGGDKLVPTLVGDEVDRKKGEALRKAHGRYYFETIAAKPLRALDGAEELLVALRRRGVQTALATSSQPEELRATLKSANAPLDQWVDAVVAKQPEQESKPAPDLVEAALEELRVSPERSLFVGDTIFDALASRRSRVRFVGVLSGGTTAPWALTELGALAVFQSPLELYRNLDALLAR